jgi:hypothetical protein
LVALTDAVVPAQLVPADGGLDGGVSVGSAADAGCADFDAACPAN